MTDIAPQDQGQETTAPDGTEQAAQVAEAAGATVDFEWRGVAFHIPAMDDWDMDVFDMLERNDVNNFLRSVLGADGYQAFRASQPKPKVRDLRDLFAVVEKAAGFQQGEVSASPPS